MVDVAVKIKYAIGIFILTSIIIIGGKALYKKHYIEAYKKIELNKIEQCSGVNIGGEASYWTAVTEQRFVDNLEKKYNVELKDIDLGKEMLVVSYGAEILTMDYNKYEPKFKNKHVAYVEFDEITPNTIYFYEAELIPICDTDFAGYPPEDRGKYR